MTDRERIVLCCFLWALPGQRGRLRAYEDTVLALLSDHGGQVIQRVRGDGSDGNPDEVQILSFDNRAGFDGFMADPRRTTLTAERDACIARTQLFPVEIDG